MHPARLASVLAAVVASAGPTPRSRGGSWRASSVRPSADHPAPGAPPRPAVLATLLLALSGCEVDIWGGVGAAYEWTESRTSRGGGVARVAYRGPQLFFAESGFDVAPTRNLFLGPFTRASFGHYDALSAETALEGSRSESVRHAAPLVWFDLGLRSSFAL